MAMEDQAHRAGDRAACVTARPDIRRLQDRQLQGRDRQAWLLAFDSADEGRLLMLAPAGWPYQPGEKKMTRFDACTLNRIAQLVAGEGAAEIKYRGMKPGDITSRVAAACKVGLTPNQRDKAHP